MAILIEICGDQQRKHRLSKRATLGRADTNTVCIQDPLISRSHAEIIRGEDGNYSIVDLDSTHGTYVGARRIKEHMLEDGCEVILGATRLLFRQETDAYARTRWDERIPCDLPIGVELEGGEVLEARATDISLGGMRISLDRELPVDSSLRVQLRFPDVQESQSVIAHVVYCDSVRSAVGISFEFAKQGDKKAFAERFAVLLRESKRDSRS